MPVIVAVKMVAAIGRPASHLQACGIEVALACVVEGIDHRAVIDDEAVQVAIVIIVERRKPG